MRALRNAVANSTEGHAYLFSGPRGTGKTSTARILAKALNCENLHDGEPCCECHACLEIEAGRSFDLMELDAASNNGVEAIRDLIERSVVGSPGRTKVYILDEVHMLSTAASNALLKTLEEPPEQVCFVLATTDPHKVLPTIRSRTQHFEFSLLTATELEDYVRWVVADAGLTVDDDAVSWVVRQGRGSARDTLSALDQVVAAGGVVVRTEPVEQLYQAVADKDPGAAIAAVADALAQGHDPRVLGDAFLTSLRDCFLVSLGVEVPHLVDADQGYLADWAQRLGTATITRTMESVGAALVEMRQAADPRIPLEVALVRLTQGADQSVEALAARVAALEAALAEGGAPVAAPGGAAAPAPSAAATPAPRGDGHTGAASARAALAKTRGGEEAAAAQAAAAPPAAPVPAAPAPAEPAPAAPAPPADPEAGAPATPAAAPPSAPPATPGARPALGAVRGRQGRAGGPPPVPGRTPAPEPAAEPVVPEPSVAEPTAAQPTAPAAAEPATAPATPAAAAPAPAAEPAPAPAPAPTPVAAAASGGDLDVERVVALFGESVVPALKGVGKALYTHGRVVRTEGDTVVFALENPPTRDRADKYREPVEQALTSRLGRPVSVRLITEDEAGDGGVAPAATPAAAAAEEAAAESEIIAELDDLEVADVAVSGIDKLTKAFPGATLVDEDQQEPF